MTILITGGAGFIGRHLVKTLVLDGHRVRVFDNLSSQVHGPSPQVPRELAGAELVRGDIRDRASIVEALVDVDAVVHLAAETGVGQSMYEVERYVDVNERGTASLMQALMESPKPPRIVLASSRAVYGEGLYFCERCGEVSPPPRFLEALSRGEWDPVCPQCGGTIDLIATHESASPRPGSVYAATKLAQEHLCRIVGAAYGITTIVLRFFNVYGPGQSLSNPYTGILSTFYARANNGKAIEVYEDGRESRDFIYVDDVVEATCRALFLADTATSPLTINVGSGNGVSIADLARAITQIGGWDLPIRVTQAYRQGDIRHAVADTTRAKNVLDFTAATSLEEGLQQWLRWAESSRYRDDTDSAMEKLREFGLYRETRAI